MFHASELGVIFGFCFLASSDCFVDLCFWKVAKAYELFVHADVDRPLLIALTPRHAGDAGLVVFEPPAVHHVLAVSAWPKIAATVIQCVVISMVTAKAPKDHVMHEGSTVATPRVKGMRALVPKCMPIPLRQPLVIGGVNDGYLAMRKWDVSDRLILRLNNRRAANPAFGHDPTSNRIAAFSRSFIVPRKVTR